MTDPLPDRPRYPFPDRLIVFDVDGTLVDSQHLIVAAMAQAFADCGLPLPPRPTVLSVVGLSLIPAMAKLVPDTPDAAPALADAYRASFYSRRTAGDSAPLYPGARDTLRMLAAAPGTLLGVATGKARRGLDHVLAQHRLEDLFVTLQTADNHPSKPHPAMLEAALLETGCAADRAVMIGDTEYDIAMGRAAGMATIGVSWGYHPEARLREAGADAIADDFPALEAALAALAR